MEEIASFGTSADVASSVLTNETPIADGQNEIPAEPEADDVARIDTTYYKSLAAAIEAAQANETVTLLANVELTEVLEIPANATVTLDLNGCTISGGWNGTSTTNHIYVLTNRGTLTIQDTAGNGAISSRGIYNYGKLTLESGAINAIDGNGGYAVLNQTDSTFVMNGGTVAATNEDDHQSSSGGYDATALKVPADCTAILNGGTINSVCDFTFAVEASGTLNIPATSTIEINGAHGAINVRGGTTTIDAGTFSIPKDEYTRTDNVLYVSGGSLTVNGGTFTGDSDTAASGSCLWDEAGTAVINGGTFSGSVGGDVWGTTGTTIKGGKFENLTEKQHIAPGFKLDEDGMVAADNDLTYVQFVERLTENNGVFDGESKVKVILKESERSYQNGTTTAQFYLPANNPNIFNHLDAVNISNVTFVYEADKDDEKYTVGELQVIAADISFTGCTFEGVSVSPWGVSNEENAVSATFTDCTWKNLTDRYGVHQNRASALTVTGCSFENVERGIHTNSSTVSSITITGNTFTGIGADFGVLCLAENGDLTKAVLNITGNTAKDQVMLRQLNPTTTYAQAEAILKNNTYGTDYVDSEKVIIPAAPNYLAQIGEEKFETLAAALEYAKAQNLSNVTITLMGETTKESAIALDDSFNLYTKNTFDSVTFKQADASKPYYIAGLYTGSRTNGGEFLFDGVNIVVTDQYIFEGNVRLTNNSVVKSVADANCFQYNATTTIEPGSKLYGVIDDYRGGDVIVDGGRTDGTFNAEPDMQNAILIVNWSGDSLTLKDGAYVKVNAANEVGRVTVNAGAKIDLFDSRLDAVQYITVNGALNLDTESQITTGKIDGAGTITIDAAGFTKKAEVIKADMSGFTGTVNVINNDLVVCKVTNEGVVIKPAPVVLDDVKGYETLAEALTAANDGSTVELIWTEGDAPIAMNGSVFGKSVTITGTATVDWSKGFLFVGRGGAGNGTVIFDNANLTSASNSSSYGIHVSGREKNTTDKYNGTVVIENSTIELDYLINKGAMTLDNSTLTVKNGFSVGGRPASETENGEDATATMTLNNGSKLVVNNHNGMGLGYEAIGVMNIDATSAFETTQSFLVTAKGTMNIAGIAKVAGTLTNNGSIVLTDAAATLTASECGNVTTTVADYEVKYADGAYKLAEKPVAGEIAYRAYIEDSASREAIKVDLKNVFAKESVAVKLYDANGNLLITSNLKAGRYEGEWLTTNIVLSGTPSGSWNTEIHAEKLTVANVPTKIELWLDGERKDTFENALGNITDAAEYQLPAYLALDCVYKEAKIGDTYYATVKNAIDAAKAGETITLLADADLAFTDDPMYNNVYASVIDLNGKTLTIQDGNLRFSTCTIKNGNIVVGAQGDYSGNGVFYMFEDNVLTLDNVKVIAENISGYSVFCMEDSSNLVLENSEVTINGGAFNYGIIAAVSSGMNTINNSKITANNMTGRGFQNGNYTIKGDSEITLTGITKDGFFIGAKNTLDIQDTTQVNITLNPDKEGRYGINLAEGAVYNKAATATVNATDNVPKPVAQIGETKYETLAAALSAAENNATVELLWANGDAPIAMNGSVFGKTVTITGTATVDWSKGFLFVGRGGEGNGTVIFDNANLTSASDNASTGIHVSGREKGEPDKCDGTVVINNSTIELDYLINKGAMTLDNSTLTVKNGFAVGGRPASETETGADATATMTLNNGSKLVVNNHNGMGLGYEAIGVMNIDATSTFETTKDFLITAKGTLNVNGGNVKTVGTLTNNGIVNVATDAAVETTAITGTGKLIIDASELTAGEAPVKGDASGYTGTIELINNTNDLSVSIVDGKIMLLAPVAQIGNQKFATLAAAVENAAEGDTITLLAPVVVNAGETLELNKAVTITYTSDVPGEDMITNRGTLVVDGATLVYTNTDTTATNVTVSTISCEPGSVLEVKSGVVKNDSVNNSSLGIYAYAIDLLTNGSLGDVTATISGGKVISNNYMAIRQFNNGTACKNTLTVTDGEIYGEKRAIQVHLKNNAAYTTISGGNIESGEGGYALCLFPENAEHLSVTGGNFNGTIYSGTNGFITGGTYNEEVYADYCAAGYVAEPNGDGTYSVVEAEKRFDISFASMTLGNALDMSFAFKAEHMSDWNGAYVEIEKVDPDGTALTQTIQSADWDKTTIENERYYTVTFTGLAAKEMANAVKVTVYGADGKPISNTWTDSVRDYAERKLDNIESTDEARTMIVDMLNYGAAAQTFFQYNTDDLANNRLTDAQKALATGDVSFNDTSVGGANFIASSLKLESNINLMMLFENIDQSMYAMITFTNHEGKDQNIRVAGTEFVKYQNNQYIVYVDALVVADCRKDVTVTVYNGETAVASATDSVESYVARKMSENDNPLFKMILRFADSADAFFH